MEEIYKALFLCKAKMRRCMFNGKTKTLHLMHQIFLGHNKYTLK
jgi:hypothetical protein